nr:MAG TPA: hypothetical protein [Caudoviricetes sp.]
MFCVGRSYADRSPYHQGLRLLCVFTCPSLHRLSKPFILWQVCCVTLKQMLYVCFLITMQRYKVYLKPASKKQINIIVLNFVNTNTHENALCLHSITIKHILRPPKLVILFCKLLYCHGIARIYPHCLSITSFPLVVMLETEYIHIPNIVRHFGECSARAYVRYIYGRIIAKRPQAFLADVRIYSPTIAIKLFIFGHRMATAE